MTVLGTLLPILEEAEWSGGSLALAERLVRDDEALYMPLVAYGYDGAERRSFVTIQAMEDEGRTLEAIAAEARANLVTRAIGLRPRSDGAVVAIDEYASSMLAVGVELERLRVALEADAILLASPTRGLLVAIGAPAKGDLGLSRFARESFATALEARITPLVFRWDGETLEVHREGPFVPERAELVESEYDEDAERLVLRLEGDALPSIVRAIDRIVRNGRTEDGRAVAELVVLAAPPQRAVLGRRFGEAIELAEVP